MKGHDPRLFVVVATIAIMSKVQKSPGKKIQNTKEKRTKNRQKKKMKQNKENKTALNDRRRLDAFLLFLEMCLEDVRATRKGAKKAC